jgi:hypothetical protein
MRRRDGSSRSGTVRTSVDGGDRGSVGASRLAFAFALPLALRISGLPVPRSTLLLLGLRSSAFPPLALLALRSSDSDGRLLLLA